MIVDHHGCRHGRLAAHWAVTVKLRCRSSSSSHVIPENDHSTTMGDGLGCHTAVVQSTTGDAWRIMSHSCEPVAAPAEAPRTSDGSPACCSPAAACAGPRVGIVNLSGDHGRDLRSKDDEGEDRALHCLATQPAEGYCQLVVKFDEDDWSRGVEIEGRAF